MSNFQFLEELRQLTYTDIISEARRKPCSSIRGMICVLPTAHKQTVTE